MHGLRLLSVLLLTLLAACSGEPRPVVAPGTFTGQGENPVFVVNHGWHTGVIVDATVAQQRIPELAERFGNLPYLEFGWGNRDFYEADDASVLMALRAAFPGETVVHVVGLHQPWHGYLADAGVVKLCLDDAELAALLDFLAASFQRTPEGQVMARGRSHEMGQFYNGRGIYHLANTCNVWTARALQSIGMDLSSRSKLTAGSVMGYLERHPAAKTLSPPHLSISDFSCS